ncbi:MAG: amidohydrolase family protein [Myxococcota bacterium]|nr:amidohydrolase family protein [Myxococcota bacterium]
MKLYSDAVVLPRGRSDLRIEPALVTLSKGTISAVETGASATQQRGDSDVEDLGERLLSPAFINTHTHLALSALRGVGQLDRMRGNVVEQLFYQVESKLEPGDIRAFVRMGAYEALCSGTGTVWDHYYGGLQVAEGLKDVGLTGVVAPTLQDLSGPGVSQLDAQLEATEVLATSTDWLNSGIAAALGPHATDTVSDRLWNDVRELRERLQVPIHAHVAQSIEETQRSFEHHGCSPITRLHRLGLLGAEHVFLIVHALFVSGQELDLLDPEMDVLGHCPFAQAQFAFPAPLSSWVQRNLSVALGTDCGACNDSMNVQQELRLVAGGPALSGTWSTERNDAEAMGDLASFEALQNKRVGTYDLTANSLSVERLLSWVWQSPGRLHPQLRVGRIETGHLANLILWDLNHPATWPAPLPLRAVAMSDATPAIDHVMIQGQWRGERGRFSQSLLDTPDYREAQEEATNRLRRLLARV